MSNFINDRIKEFEENFKYIGNGKTDGLIRVARMWDKDEARLKAFLKSSLIGMVEELERKLPKAEQQGISEGGDAFNDCLGRIQNLLKSYRE